jgi:undecaprenyl-diphosphatase
VLFYFRKDLLGIVTRRDYRTIALLGAGTVPVVAAGLLFEDRIEALFASPGIVSMMLYGTAFLLLAGEYLYKRVRRMNGLTAVSALGVGAAQAMALVPRSGATISAGLAFGLERDEAFSFSFLLSVPAVSAALVYKLLKAGTAAADPSVGLNYAAGAFTAFVVGMASLAVLRRVVASGKLYIFAVYCILAGTVGILYL